MAARRPTIVRTSLLLRLVGKVRSTSCQTAGRRTNLSIRSAAGPLRQNAPSVGLRWLLQRAVDVLQGVGTEAEVGPDQPDVDHGPHREGHLQRKTSDLPVALREVEQEVGSLQAQGPVVR